MEDLENQIDSLFGELDALPMPKVYMTSDVMCVFCGKLAQYYSDAGRREIAISQVCEPCFDRMFEH